MNIFYEDGGQLKVATVIQKNEATYQVDTQHGKRVKIKAVSVFLEFNQDLNAFLNQAQQIATEIDTELLWECVGAEEFTGKTAAVEYFGENPRQEEIAATFIALYAAPMYFHKKNKNSFKAAPEDILKQALETIKRKAQQEAQIQEWKTQLLSGSLPEPIKADLATILHAPDKQALTYKAFYQAATESKKTLYELAKFTGGITSIPDYLLQRFTYRYFPNGTDFPEINVPMLPENLPLASVAAFSIDDEETTEVDDALSLQKLNNGSMRLGIHIAAPSLAITRDSEIEKLIFSRLSTVYFPANKITMLPENWIKTFSLDEGKNVPAVSMYVDISPEWQLSEPETRVELVPIAHNLRIQQIEPFFNSDHIGKAEQPQFPHHADLIYLLELAYELQKKRDRLEDKTLPKRYDYGIDFDATGKVVITRRERGSPIDTLVSEMMILANTSWAKMLNDHQLSGIFRVQPSGFVRFSTFSEAHIGMNVEHYGWFTSPLRRACDYINQKQLLSLIHHQTPRFAQNDNALFMVLNQFETTYANYRDFQNQMENYWALVYLKQENIKEINAIVLKDDLVRLEGVPLVARASGMPIDILPKTTVKLMISDINEEQQTIALKYMGS